MKFQEWWAGIVTSLILLLVVSVIAAPLIAILLRWFRFWLGWGMG